MRAPQKRRPRAGRSRSETLQGARASAEQPSEAILSKYGALRAKHEDLLLRYSALVRSRTGIASVAFTAFRGPQPLALVRQGLVVVRNGAWTELSARAEGPWRRTRADAVEAFPDLSAAAGAFAEEAHRCRGTTRATVLLEAGDLSVELHALPDPSRVEVAVAAADVSDRAAAARELEAVRAALAQTANLRALGDVAASLAPALHDALSETERHVRSLEAAPVLTARQRSDVRAIASGVREALEHVRRLADVSSDGSSSAPTASLAAALHDAIELLRPGLGAGVEVAVDVTPELPPIAAEPGGLTRALVHLLLRARDVLSGTGALRLRARRGGAWVVLEIVAEAAGGEAAAESAPAAGAIPEDLVSRIGGLVATSALPGRGAAITVTLPAGPRSTEGGDPPERG